MNQALIGVSLLLAVVACGDSNMPSNVDSPGQPKTRMETLVMKFIVYFLITSAAFAQTSAPKQPVSWVQSDSSLRTQTMVQQYDFYYSAKQAEQFTQMSNVGYTQEDRIKKKRFRDRTFTEIVLKGRKPADDFDDYTLIGSGILADVNSGEEW